MKLLNDVHVILEVLIPIRVIFSRVLDRIPSLVFANTNYLRAALEQEDFDFFSKGDMNAYHYIESLGGNLRKLETVQKLNVVHRLTEDTAHVLSASGILRSRKSNCLRR